MFMRSLAIFAVATLALSTAIGGAIAHDYKVGDLTIDHPWTRATPPAAKAGGGYMKITNDGTETERLVGGKADFANRVEIHEMAVEDGIMRMRPLNEGLEIPPGETVELKPGSFHIMFMGLTEPLVEGETRTISISFEQAGDVNMDFPVEAMGTTMDHDHGDGEMKMDHSDHGDHSGHDHSGHSHSTKTN
ncbi:MAG: copper chaperone PCu(A)C [Pseudomonadota bacterium]